jgi:hypothetical protein
MAEIDPVPVVVEYGCSKREGVELARAYDNQGNLEYVKCRFDIINRYGVFTTKYVTETLEKWIDVQYVGWIR